jgi:hypothetical protein
MKIPFRKIFIFVVLIFAIAGTAAGVFYFLPPPLEKLESFGKYRVGEKGVSFSGTTDYGQKVGTGKPPGRFHIRLFTNELPRHVRYSCLDHTCGHWGDLVVRLGGHLDITIDSKISNIYGLKYKHKRQLNGKIGWVPEHSLAIVEDNKGIILSIFKNARLSNLEDLLREAEIDDIE